MHPVGKVSSFLRHLTVQERREVVTVFIIVISVDIERERGQVERT